MIEALFRVIARIETPFWDQDLLTKHQIEVAFGLYLFQESEASYLCSLTPSSRIDFLQNSFIGGDDDLHDLHMEPGEDTYVNFIRTDRIDRRFITSPRLIEGETDEELWENAREQLQNEAPLITWETVYRAWEAEQVLIRRAENRSVNSLPLFSRS